MNRDLFDFITASPTSFHAVSTISKRLTDAGFVPLSEGEIWKLNKGGKYYATRNYSSIIAFNVGNEISDFGFNITASHSDSPSFKLKEEPVLTSDQYTRLNTERYGGAILSTWFDRPLSIAGRVIVERDGRLESRLINIDRDLLIIPNVSIHFNRDLNSGYKYNEQVDTLPLLAQRVKPEALKKLIAEAADTETDNILSHELYLYCRSVPTVWGAENEFISAPRLDDLQCAFATLMGFINSENSRSVNVYCCFDNEEVGSQTKQGAASNFLADTLYRISNGLGYAKEEHLCALSRSFMLSADNAHALHPNHPELSDSVNRPVLNGGPAVKVNAAQSYATDAPASALFRLICKKADVPAQVFANRSDKRGGGTLGNIAAGSVSITMADIGLPQLAMHSAYETAGGKDTEYLVRASEKMYSVCIGDLML
ncbi:MAG: M18 family aminopeptidase [Ruminococcaceae bacterium]|nr:M18 family aminopeptidase [Oscillospiraceae bacterium]